ncbi:hypothetical protein EVAR_86356_1 [Eumeta japonica]|uniref:Uncharacterized protein n=1 Tax=Eumeta variegata TaxID=151549 RepID=A0A4C1YCL5_EUMVA|nr:hypothetical protein EVAR_86356_1 [Eumeta japonica]
MSHAQGVAMTAGLLEVQHLENRHRYSQPPRSHQCVAGLLERNRIPYGGGRVECRRGSGPPELSLPEGNAIAKSAISRIYYVRVWHYAGRAGPFAYCSQVGYSLYLNFMDKSSTSESELNREDKLTEREAALAALPPPSNSVGSACRMGSIAVALASGSTSARLRRRGRGPLVSAASLEPHRTTPHTTRCSLPRTCRFAGETDLKCFWLIRTRIISAGNKDFAISLKRDVVPTSPKKGAKSGVTGDRGGRKSAGAAAARRADSARCTRPRGTRSLGHGNDVAHGRAAAQTSF